MKRLLATVLIAFASLVGFAGLSGCEADEGPVEEVGEEIDEGAEEVGDEMDDVTEEE